MNARCLRKAVLAALLSGAPGCLRVSAGPAAAPLRPESGHSSIAGDSSPERVPHMAAMEAGRAAVRRRQDERLVDALSFLDRSPENPKALAMGAFAGFVLASRGHGAMTTARLATANAHIRLIQGEKAADRNTYWILPLLSRLAVDPDVTTFLETSAQAALKELLFPAADSWFTLADAATDETTVWRLDGSDNHDIMRKQTAYLTAQFLAANPEWAETRYRDGHTAVEHRDAWAAFFREYFRQRSLRGLSVEMASPCYAGVLLYPIVNLRDVAGDARVRDLAEKYLHVTFADAAQESLRGVRGGAKTRAYKYAHIIGYRDKTACYSWLLTGLPDASVGIPFEAFPGLATDYRLPEPVLELYYLTDARGVFESVTVRPGRGSHRAPPVVYQVRFPSCLRRTSFVTPRYVLGSFTTHEEYEYTMLISQNHWMGLIAADAPASRVVLTAAVPPHRDKNHHDLQAVQKRGTALFRRHNRCAARREIRAFVSDTFLLDTDDSGWVLAENSDGTVFIALRASDPDEDGRGVALEPVTHLGVRGTWVRFLNRDAVIVMECGWKGEFDNMEHFAQAVRECRGGWVSDNAFEYHGRHGILTLFRDRSLPLIDGHTVELHPPRIYNSPYLIREEGSNRVVVRGVSGTSLSLDFGLPE